MIQPYRGDSDDVFANGVEDTYGDSYRNLIADINSASPLISAHTGDVKSGGTLCNNKYCKFVQSDIIFLVQLS